ncbi:MAG: bifunctional phosphoglucose/phosphomannose isomerase [Microthrixaceae bacterium]
MAVLDTLDMLGAALGLPEQLESAQVSARAVDGLPSGDGISSVVVMGMGGSGIGGDAAAAVLGPQSPVPIMVSKHYECPAFVGPDTLVFANSFSGNTEETLNAVGIAAERGARVVVVASGGRLVELAGQIGAPVVPVDTSIPMPRAGIGAVTVPLLVVLDRLGLVDDTAPMIASAVEQLRRRRDELSGDDNSATRLARRIGRTMPLVYGGGALGEVAGWRWKGQFNENCKVPSWCNRIPELTHNELCGWAQHGDVTRQVFTLLFLRHSSEAPNIGRRFDFVAESCDEVVAGIHSVTAQGDTPLAELFDLVLLGDLVTLHMAFNEGVDPGPVDILDQLKGWLRT